MSTLTNDQALAALLASTHTIAIVGLSNKPERPSYGVARYLQQHGYRIVPVNPALKGQVVLGEASYDTLQAAHAALAVQGQRIQMVDVFRKAEDLPSLLPDVLAIQPDSLWLQLGIAHPDVEAQAAAQGLTVVSNHCIKIEHARLASTLLVTK